MTDSLPDIILVASGDSRLAANQTCWPAQAALEGVVIETFAALGAALEGADADDDQPIAHDRRGVAYRSVMPAPRERR